MSITKAVIPAAGWGTRLLPVTKTQPKEMLPVGGKPLIQFAVEEAAEAGITDITIIISPNRQAIIDYFAPAPDLAAVLTRKNELGLLNDLARLEDLANLTYIIQEEPLGLGHAVALAHATIGDEPFAVILPDDLIDHHESGLRQMLPIFIEYRTSVIAVETVDAQATRKYGIIRPERVSERIYKVDELVEKPSPEAAPSTLGIVGRYLITPAIFEALARTTPDSRGEIQLTDALTVLLTQQDIYALELQGTRYDTGEPLGWLEAQVAYGLKHPEAGERFRHRLRRLI
ncbi:MAG: UTP--glucose-1-phosphate uridylyltransferase [Dehalococcoidia bacterium]|nr:UTP--glucose-1-phosphate uridylyltransferase [Dehalococcoidia bacterium]